jgi:hypothetical protein
MAKLRSNVKKVGLTTFVDRASMGYVRPRPYLSKMLGRKAVSEESQRVLELLEESGKAVFYHKGLYLVRIEDLQGVFAKACFPSRRR